VERIVCNRPRSDQVALPQWLKHWNLNLFWTNPLMRRLSNGTQSSRAEAPPVMPEIAAPPAGSGLPKPAQMQQPPMGVSPATGPTPNKGYEAAAMQKVATAIKFLEAALSQVGSTSDIGKVVLESLTKLSKMAPPGSVSQAAQRNELDEAQRKNMQAQQMQKQLNAPPGAGGQPGGAPGGGMPQPQGMAA
jgi:hypothetical protein